MAAASISSALISPFLGAWADGTSSRCRILGIAAICSCIAAVAFSFASELGVVVSLMLVAMCHVGLALSTSLYNSLLPCLFTREQAHTASPTSCAFSNLGAGI